MTLSPYLQEVAKRRTFAIISHPDAGKTTITEKVLLFGQAIQTAGTVKGRGSSQHAKSDWMEMEKQRGISITTSVMQFPYHDCLVNLLDTPGHEDFSEDTYRTLTAVDCCLMVIDAAKGVEDRTRKLMEVTRLRDTPILTFMNKLDRDIRDPMELMDEVENELKIACAPITWPIGCGKLFKGVYHLYKDETYLYQTGKGHTIQEVRIVKGLDNPELDAAVGEELAAQLAARGMIAATALGTKEQILAAAAKVEGLTDLRVTAEKGDEVSFTATSTAGADLRAALSKALAEAGCPVVSLTSDTMSLEDIFLQITETAPEKAQPEETEEPAPEAAAAQPEPSAEPAEPQVPADDTPEQPEAENDQKEEE